MAVTRTLWCYDSLLFLGASAVAAALCAGSLRAHSVDDDGKSKVGDLQTTTAKADPANSQLRIIKGVVLDGDENAVSSAVAVGGIGGTGMSNHQVFTTDGERRFPWAIPAGGNLFRVFAHKPGTNLATWTRWLDADSKGNEIERTDRTDRNLQDGHLRLAVGGRVFGTSASSVEPSERRDEIWDILAPDHAHLLTESDARGEVEGAAIDGRLFTRRRRAQHPDVV